MLNSRAPLAAERLAYWLNALNYRASKPSRSVRFAFCYTAPASVLIVVLVGRMIRSQALYDPNASRL